MEKQEDGKHNEGYAKTHRRTKTLGEFGKGKKLTVLGGKGKKTKRKMKVKQKTKNRISKLRPL